MTIDFTGKVNMRLIMLPQRAEANELGGGLLRAQFAYRLTLPVDNIEVDPPATRRNTHSSGKRGRGNRSRWGMSKIFGTRPTKKRLRKPGHCYTGRANDTASATVTLPAGNLANASRIDAKHTLRSS
ncbi:MAG: hypothetical protein ACRDTA_12115 [Pseudonocardiaceae bacterium]